MKVIIPGRLQHGWAREYICSGRGNGSGGCGALLLVEESDLFFTHSYARDTQTDYVSFKCPCGVTTDVWSEYDRKDREALQACRRNLSAD